MPTWFYDTGPNGLWIFLLLTLILGGGGAFISGKSIAETWRPLWQVPMYMVLLASGVRFMHFALFEEVFVSVHNFIVDYAALLGLALAGYRLARARQMAIQYGAISRGN